MTTPEPNIVAGLPKDTPEVEYDDQMDLLREAQRLFKELKAKKSSCDYVVFKNVPRDKTSDVFDEDTRAQIGDYDEETKILVLQWNGRAHNIAIDRLVLQLSLKLHSLGLGPETKTSWRAEIRLPTRIKQPWQQYIVSVDHYPPGRSGKWPTMVFSCGLCESGPKLEKDMEFWLNESKGDVKIGVTLVIDQKFIEIFTWSAGKPKQPETKSEPEPEQESQTASKKRSSTSESDLPATKKRGVTNGSDQPEPKTRASKKAAASSKSKNGGKKEPVSSQPKMNGTRRGSASSAKKNGTKKDSPSNTEEESTSPDSKIVDGAAKTETQQESAQSDSPKPSDGGITKRATVRVNKGRNNKPEFANGVDSIAIPFAGIFTHSPRPLWCEENFVIKAMDLMQVAQDVWMNA